MAKMSEFDRVLASLDAQIAKLQDTKDTMLAARNAANPVVRRERKPKKAKAAAEAPKTGF